MKLTPRTALRIALGIAFLLALYYLTPVGAFLRIPLAVHRGNLERKHLLYETDHYALLQACRQMIPRRQEFSRDQSWYGTDNASKSFIDPNDPSVPTVVQNLEPSYIVATEVDVELELHGGFDHYGVIAIAESALEDGSNRFDGLLELIPGLWYYDEGLAYDRVRWITKLKNMKPSNAIEPTW